jgi:Trk-type K+ transport system membrane component
MLLTILFVILGLCALGTVVLGVFMLIDFSKRSGDKGFASRMTKAVDRTAKANGLWTKAMRIRAVIFLVLLIGLAVAAVLVLEYMPRGGGGFNWG